MKWGATSKGLDSDKDWNKFAFYKLSETWFIHTGHGRSRGRSGGVYNPESASQNTDKDNVSHCHQNGTSWSKVQLKFIFYDISEALFFFTGLSENSMHFCWDILFVLPLQSLANNIYFKTLEDPSQNKLILW